MDKLGQYSSRQVLIFKTIMQLLEEGVTNITYAKISERCHLHINTIPIILTEKTRCFCSAFSTLSSRKGSRLPAFISRFRLT